MVQSKRTVVLSITLIVWAFWLTILGHQTALSHLIRNWEVAVTMLAGSIIAGGTSIGGGAVAFPVFTKILLISPHDAKVFSLAIQTVGMGAASFAIWMTRIKVEGRVIIWGSLGGSMGIFLGLVGIAPRLPADVVKMSFTLILSSFALTLLALNQRSKQRHLELPLWGTQERAIILGAGILGGLLSSCVGNGIDILIFAVMVLLFRVSEHIATPTSIVLMAINASVGLVLQVFVLHDFPIQVQDYWFAAIPIVVVGAPLGAMFCSLLRQETIAHILIGLISIELVTSILLIPLRPTVIYTSVMTVALFAWLNYRFYQTKRYQVSKHNVTDWVEERIFKSRFCQSK